MASPWFPLEKTKDWGATVGLGARQQISKHWSCHLDLTYSHGFSDIYNTISSVNRLPELAKGNRTVAANLGVVFMR